MTHSIGQAAQFNHIKTATPFDNTQIGINGPSLMGRPIAVIVVGIVETVFGAKKQAGDGKDSR
jgi:hypothetical protein